MRVIEYRILNPQRGCRKESARLITSLLDAEKYPARELIELYHQRWEIEIGYDELKTHLLGRNRLYPIFRSKKAEGVIQELYGVMLLYTVIRLLMQEAANKYDLDARRLSFMNSVHIVRRTVVSMQALKAERLPDLYEELLDQIAATLLPPKENRVNPRVIRRDNVNFPVKNSKRHCPYKIQKPFVDELEIIRFS